MRILLGVAMMTKTAALVALNAAMLLSSHVLTIMQDLCMLHYAITNKLDLVVFC
jgi:hypothetical protein